MSRPLSGTAELPMGVGWPLGNPVEVSDADAIVEADEEPSVRGSGEEPVQMSIRQPDPSTRKCKSSRIESLSSTPDTNESGARKACFSVENQQKQKTISVNGSQAPNIGNQKLILAQVTVEVGVWDGRTCQLTRREVPGCEVAQIHPAKLHGNALNAGDIDEMWYWLEYFWGEEKVSKWQDLLVEGSGLDMDRMYNLITLDSHIHKYWNAGLVALQPGKRNEYGTEIQFALHWFPDWQELNDMSP